MRFMPMGRPIRPRPINPIFLGPRTGSTKVLLENGGRKPRRYPHEKEDTIVTESMGGSCEGGARVRFRRSWRGGGEGRRSRRLKRWRRRGEARLHWRGREVLRARPLQYHGGRLRLLQRRRSG